MRGVLAIQGSADQASRRRRTRPASNSSPASTSRGPVAPPPPPLLDSAGPLETTIVTADEPSTKPPLAGL